ncbi:phospho-N-acetylmuramoyl-pentapeptide-transferase [bacterium]|nr:phospho-N-acetylmuramoyl-pentapeptide-transferase [bacterium]
MLYLLKSSIFAFIFSCFFSFSLIRILRRRGIGQRINLDAPERHRKKEGTPTMGGIAIVISTCLVYLLMRGNNYSLPLTILGFSLIGFLDDYLSIKRGKSLGLKARHKLLLQIILSVVVLLSTKELTTYVHTPSGVRYFELGYFYPLFAILLLVGFSNAVNLTDGLDGLAGGCSAIVAGGMALVALSLTEHDYGVFLAGLSGACLGFLWFNLYPAKIIMGDTGSLAIGGALAYSSILLKEELLFIWMGLVFLAEALSVMIQVFSYKTRGKRVFKMTPLHHHFELSGWEEPLITTRFWLVNLVIVLIGYWLTLLR